MIKKYCFFFLLWLPLVSFSQNADIDILRRLNSPISSPCDDFTRLVSDSEIYISLGVPAGIAAVALVKKERKLLRNVCVILAAEAVTSGISTAMKYSINRDRPFQKYADIKQKSSAGSPSFPSGHTSNSFATATSLSLAYPKWYVIAPSFVWAGTVGYSRMELGVHYPSDVLAGALIGSGTAWLTHVVNKKLNRKH